MQAQKSEHVSTLSLLLLYALFFMWGFVWNLFNVLVSFFQEAFQLSNTQTSLGTSLSFLAFFLASLNQGERSLPTRPSSHQRGWFPYPQNRAP
jgi:fucose permease